MKEQEERSGSKKAKDDITKDSNVQVFKGHAFSFSILPLSLLPPFLFCHLGKKYFARSPFLIFH